MDISDDRKKKYVFLIAAILILTFMVIVFIFKDRLKTSDQVKKQEAPTEEEKPRPVSQEEIKETLQKKPEEDVITKEVPVSPDAELKNTLVEKAEQAPAAPVSSNDIQDALNAKAK